MADVPAGLRNFPAKKKHFLAINWLALKAFWVRVNQLCRGLVIPLAVRKFFGAIIPCRLAKPQVSGSKAGQGCTALAALGKGQTAIGRMPFVVPAAKPTVTQTFHRPVWLHQTAKPYS